MVVYVQRDCNPPSDRDTYIHELMKHMKIDSYGPCLNNKRIPKDIDGFVKLSSKPYYHFLARYKFQIAFENSRCKDYMTEKVFRPLCIGSVPVYFGSRSARDFMPTNHSIIMADDFASPKELAEYLTKLNSNDKLYNEYLVHRETGVITNQKLLDIIDAQPWKLPHVGHKSNFGQFMFEGYTCHVCDKIHERDENRLKHSQNASHPLLPPSIANEMHLGCPLPVRSVASNETYYSKQKVYKYGAEEAKAIFQMLRANETDSSRFQSKYLRMKTDKYP